MAVIEPLAAPKLLDEVIRQRRSTRHFSNRRVDQGLVEKIFQTAQWSPSVGNMQPWRSFVVSGASCDRVRQALLTAANNTGQFPPSKPALQKPGSQYVERDRALKKQLFSTVAAGKTSQQSQDILMDHNFQLYGAPHCAFVFLEQGFNERTSIDLGMYAQNLMLQMEASGIASCVQAEVCVYADLIKQQLNINEPLTLMFAISFGYQQSSDINQLKRSRAPLFETTTFYN
ncbi:Nitroreductase NfnB [Sinobacterium norvegicum]|uniref:Nitroreductase NfnB n=1 Tax=Sinobacterium norvegicum TaxID=1641715 RepID=A0ABM9AI08_9GAMM|nr:nitroreductase [Sinobacterium norvegicum]CAH0992774.1 Nitroreductase NfnB [Sinobacterium norvegicum]